MYLQPFLMETTFSLFLHKVCSYRKDVSDESKAAILKMSQKKECFTIKVFFK